MAESPQPTVKLFHGLSPLDYFNKYTGYLQASRAQLIQKHLPDKSILPVPSPPNNAEVIQQLKNQLETAKKNLETQEIYDIHNKLGEEYLAIQAYGDAVEVLSQGENYAATPRHKFLSAYNLLRTYIYQNEWDSVYETINTIRTLIPPDFSSEEKRVLNSQLCIAFLIICMTRRTHDPFPATLARIPPEHASCLNEVFPSSLLVSRYPCIYYMHSSSF